MGEIEIPLEELEEFALTIFVHRHIKYTLVPFNKYTGYYRLDDGDYGLISGFGFRKIDERRTDFSFIGPNPKIEKDEIAMLLTDYYSNHNQPMPLNYEEIFQKSGQDPKSNQFDIFALEEIASVEIAKQILLKRDEIFNLLIIKFFNELKQEFPGPFSRTNLDAVLEEIQPHDPLDHSKEFVKKPWELIPDKGHNQKIIQLWCEGLSSTEIGNRLNLASGTINVRVTRLRKQYPDAKIPYHR